MIFFMTLWFREIIMLGKLKYIIIERIRQTILDLWRSIALEILRKQITRNQKLSRLRIVGRGKVKDLILFPIFAIEIVGLH